MNKLKYIFILLITAGWAGQSVAQKAITLMEAVDMALANSHQLKLDHAKIDQRYAALKESEERKLPNASVSASYLRLANANVDYKIKSSGSSGQGGGFPSVNSAVYGLLNASLPIYAGGRIKYGIEAARILADAAKLDSTHQRQDIIMNTVESYVNLCKARAALKLMNQNLEDAKQRVTDLANLEKNGILAKNDLLKAELQQSNVESSVVDAEDNWQLANASMDILIGMADGTMLNPDTSELSRKVNPGSLPDYLSMSNKRLDMESLEKSKQAADINIKSIMAEKLPSLQLTAGYVAADIPKVLSITNAANLGLGVSYNIANLWKLKSRIAQAEAYKKQIEESEAILNDNIKQVINKNYYSMLSTQKKVEVYTKAIEQATENQRITKNKFINSLATTTEVLDADVALLQARLGSSFYRADALVAYFKLLHSAGLDLYKELQNKN